MNTKLYQKYVFSSKRLALIYNNISVLHERLLLLEIIIYICQSIITTISLITNKHELY